MDIGNLYPKTSGELTIKKNQQDYFIRDKYLKKDIVANEDLTLILRECKGEKSVNEISKVMSDKKQLPLERIGEVVEKFMRSLEKDNIIQFSKEKDPVSIRYRETNFSFPLDTAYLEVTKKCNFPCIHCFAGSPSFTTKIDNEGEMTLDQYKNDVIPSLEKAGVLGTCITGGEPFFRKDITDIFNLLNRHGIEFGVLSNGYFIDEKRVNELKELRPRFIGISFDSHKEEIFEQIRGKNKYKKVLESIERLNDAGLKPSINCILFNGLNDSYKHIYEFVDFLNKKGISPNQITFDQMVPEGEGKSLDKYLIDEKKTVSNISKSFKDLFDMDFSELKKPEYSDRKTSFCGLGQEVIYVGSQGDISLCPALSGKEYIAGNILDDNLGKIWEYSPVFQKFRDPNFFKNTSCNDCDSLEECVGGCRAKSMTFSGDFNSVDPWMCAFYRKD